MFPYLPHTDKEISEMLEAIGIDSLDDLFADIPADFRKKAKLTLDPGISEYEVFKEMCSLSQKNIIGTSFLGLGSYDHIIPATVGKIIGLPTFYTSYTPYQPEISQGVLQAIFEFQTLICQLTGLDVSNASLYDGCTAAIEAGAIAINSKRKSDTILCSETVHPFTKQVVKTYFKHLGVKVKDIPAKNGLFSCEAIKEELTDSVAAVIVQTPNFFGSIEDYTGLADMVHENKSLLIISSNPLSLGLLKSQGEWGADIAIGDAQPFGLPAYFGGPSVGYISATEKLLRKMPGRIAGQAEDLNGKRAFVLTLQAREQHIKRERATSNICSNQALMALANSVYLASVGWKGLQEVAHQCLQKSHYLYNRLTKDLSLKPHFDNPFFNEFMLEIPQAKKVLAAMVDKGIFAGISMEQFDSSLKDVVAIAVTEKRTKAEMDLYVDTMKGVL